MLGWVALGAVQKRPPWGFSVVSLAGTGPQVTADSLLVDGWIDLTDSSPLHTVLLLLLPPPFLTRPLVAGWGRWLYGGSRVRTRVRVSQREREAQGDTSSVESWIRTNREERRREDGRDEAEGTSGVRDADDEQLARPARLSQLSTNPSGGRETFIFHRLPCASEVRND